jgi:hypothetical protein
MEDVHSCMPALATCTGTSAPTSYRVSVTHTPEVRLATVILSLTGDTQSRRIMFHAWCLSPEDPQLVAYPARPGLSPVMMTSARSAVLLFACCKSQVQWPDCVLCKHSGRLAGHLTSTFLHVSKSSTQPRHHQPGQGPMYSLGYAECLERRGYSS